MSEVDWSQFDDWLKFEGTGGEWFSPTEPQELTLAQMQVVKNNSRLLLDSVVWCEKVEAFERALASIDDGKQSEKIREDYCIRFDGYEFDRELYPELDFSNYKFPCSVSFNFVNFGSGDVSFENAIFEAKFAYFFSSQFEGGVVSFDSSQFHNDSVHFESTQFRNDEVSFSFTKFGSGGLIFSGIIFSDKTKFNSLNMIVEGDFLLGGEFLDTASFLGLNINNCAILSGSFKKCPDFRFASFGRPPEVAGMIVPKPEMKGKKLYYIFNICSDPADASKYRKLNAMAKEANDHDKELEFFAYEMMAKRGVEITGFWELLANSFYYHVSYYGQSWTRPLVGVFISWFVFTFIYLNSVATILKAGSLNFSAIYSALNSFPFLSSLHRLTLKPQDYEGSLEKTLDTLAKHDGVVDSILNWAMFQQFIGIVLLFFLLLGLRNRFRLK